MSTTSLRSYNLLYFIKLYTLRRRDVKIVYYYRIGRIYRTFALSARYCRVGYITQGVALGYVVSLGLQPVTLRVK